MYVSFLQKLLDNQELNVLQDSQQAQSVSVTRDPRHFQTDLNIEIQTTLGFCIQVVYRTTIIQIRLHVCHKINTSKCSTC